MEKPISRPLLDQDSYHLLGSSRKQPSTFTYVSNESGVEPCSAITVFISYAHADEPLRIKLEKHLSALQREGLIASWHDRHITAGTDWATAIDTHLNAASIILLLISPDFLASDYCYGVEMQRALERHESEQALVIPVLLRPVQWQESPFAKLQMLPKNLKPVTKWRNRDEAFASVISEVRRAILELNILSISTPPSTLPPLWNIPYPRNPFFTGREEVLSRLANALRVGETMALTQAQAINGLGGVGKTQIAIEYAYRFHPSYRAVLWGRADTREELISAFVALAELLNLPEKDAQDYTLTVAAVKKWMATQVKWLLILDNADDLVMVQEFIPPAFGGHLVLTTRAQAMGKLAHSIEVETMTSKEGALFLLRRIGIIAPDMPLEMASKEDCNLAMELVQELGSLPLALDQAGAYIEETSCSIDNYLRLYRRQRAALLKRRGGVVADHPEPVATTWSISFEEIEKAAPSAADLLRLCAFLSPDAIPEEIFIEGASLLGPHLQSVATDPLALNEVIRTLRTYSLVRRDVRSNTLSIHRLVQAVLKDMMSQETLRHWAERTVRIVSQVFPAGDFTTWPRCERYLPHAEACAALIEQAEMRFLEAIQLLNNVGHYLEMRAQYKEAEIFYQQVLAIDEGQLAVDHPHIAADLHHLASACFDQGKYAEAERLYLRAFQIREQQLGPNHSDTASTLNNLGSVYNRQGKPEEAKVLYQRALAIAEQQWGPNHPRTVASLYNLAGIYHHLEMHTEAKALDERLLAIYEQRVKAENSKDAFDLSVLAGFYKKQKRYAEAMGLYQQALAIDEQLWGPDHPQTADALNGLANLYQMEGEYRAAEQLYQRALTIFEEKLGRDHHLTVMVVKNYVDLLRKTKRELEAMYLEARFE